MHYSPKHAAPRLRKVKTRLAGIGIAGAATVIGGVVTANEAHAASVWDSVAQCESGQNWSINTGNGFYGGLQFTAQTWRGYGGTAYASSANLATREQQIATAQKVLADAGPGAWPVCSVWAGLTRASGSGGGTAPAATAPATTTTPSTSRTQTRTAPTTTKSTTTKSTKSTTTTTKSTNAAPAASGKTVTVKSGDTLSGLAAKYGLKGGWQALFSANTAKVKNANLIYVGQVLNLPA